MTGPYAIHDASEVLSPGLVFFADIIERNIARMIEVAGGAHRLRPHVKTHKCPEVAMLEVAAGITRHKAATIAEAEMLARCGAEDILISYPLVGPNCHRLAQLARSHPQSRFSSLVDHPASAEALSRAMTQAGMATGFFLDLNVGQNRTGIVPGPEARALYAQAAGLPGLRAEGLHVYDGHNHQEAPGDREAAVQSLLGPVLAFREQLQRDGLPVERLVCGGTPTFPVFARLDLPGLELSPGTLVLHDNGYGSKYADLAAFTPAALVLTRVISKPTPTRVTFDLGYKAIASDPPAGKRLVLLGAPPHEQVLQNEEHLVIETAQAGQLQPGDVFLAIPQHVCPTVALHQRAWVVRGGKVVGTWPITARDRILAA